MPSLPASLRIYAIGDIHGRADLLRELLGKIKAEERRRTPASSRLIFLGDYVDRGPDTFGVIELLLNGLPPRMPTDFLIGNHERLLLDALNDDSCLPLWLANGGGTVIEGYAEQARRRGQPAGQWSELSDLLPAKHLELLKALAPFAQYGEYFFVHAGVRPGIALAHQELRDLIWIREPFLSHRGSFGKIVVHGHTPVIVPEIHSNRIAIDTGAVFTGRLTALVLDGDNRNFLST